MLSNSHILYFIPEWDDLVSKYYNFETDQDENKNERVYSHEIYSKPNYDGILTSRMKLEQSKSKIKQIIDSGGVHNFFRFKGPIFGDCGAWGYVKENTPPFKTKEIMSFYEELKFDIAVSIDHLCIPGYENQWDYRKKLTIKNAEEFYYKYIEGDYSFQPVGVCQGWDTESYMDSVKNVLDIGYTYIALGGIARAKSSEILTILRSIKPLLEKNSSTIKLHLFGVARLEATRQFNALGVTSIDSASPLRTAWLSSTKNYRDMNWNGYSAIRLPFITREAKYKSIVQKGIYSFEELESKEQDIKTMLNRYNLYQDRTPEEIAEAFNYFYEELIPKTPNRVKEYLRTLKNRPWENCKCEICTEVGMEVIIFRGNNRNRRRGFHNTYVFYSLMKRLLEDPDFNLAGEFTDGDDDGNDENGGDEDFDPEETVIISAKNKNTKNLIDFM